MGGGVGTLDGGVGILEYPLPIPHPDLDGGVGGE